MSSRIEEAGGKLLVEFGDLEGSLSAFVRLKCDRIELSTTPWEVGWAVNPHWDRPYAPLARHGLEDIASRIESVRKVT